MALANRPLQVEGAASDSNDNSGRQRKDGIGAAHTTNSSTS